MNSGFFVASYLGALLAGCTCLLVDPQASPAVWELIRNRMRVRALFSHKASPHAATLDVPRHEETPEASARRPPAPQCSSSDPAVVFFTSGSTSVPKGVVLTHRNLVSNTRAIASLQRLGPSDVHEVVLPFHHCFGASLLHTHLFVGASIVINPDFRFPNTVWQDVEQYGVTGFSGVPSHYKILLSRSSPAQYRLDSLRFLAAAGGKLGVETTRELLAAFTSVDVLVMYGQTEATARIAALPPERLPEKIGSVGLPIEGTAVRVVDEHGNAVPPDTVGEIVLRGPGVMLGYYDDPDATSERIRDGWLHTGDVGRLDEDGCLWIVARRETFIKSAGNRVSAQAIAEMLEAHPGVEEATVWGTPDPLLGEAIHAAVVLRKPVPSTVDADALIEFCRERLAPYEVPRCIDVVEVIAKTAAGKPRLQRID